MSELLKLIQEADVASLDMERAKSAVEAAKLSLESAKESLEMARKAFDEVLMKADEIGVPRPKVRKLIEERTLGLVASGLMDGSSATVTKSLAGKNPAAKAPKAAKSSKASKESETDSENDADKVPMKAAAGLGAEKDSELEDSESDFETVYEEDSASMSIL